jgi:hypothetical protein
VLAFPALYVPALLAVVAVFAAREFWAWRDDLRGWLTMAGTLVVAVVVAFLLQHVGF